MGCFDYLKSFRRILKKLRGRFCVYQNMSFMVKFRSDVHKNPNRVMLRPFGTVSEKLGDG